MQVTHCDGPHHLSSPRNNSLRVLGALLDPLVQLHILLVVLDYLGNEVRLGSLQFKHSVGRDNYTVGLTLDVL